MYTSHNILKCNEKGTIQKYQGSKDTIPIRAKGIIIS